MGKISEDVFGSFQLKTSENFDEFMSKLGVSYMIRKLGNASSPVVTVTEKENVLTFKQVSLVKASEFSCQLGVPFDETSADGRKVFYNYNLYSELLDPKKLGSTIRSRSLLNSRI